MLTLTFLTFDLYDPTNTLNKITGRHWVKVFKSRIRQTIKAQVITWCFPVASTCFDSLIKLNGFRCTESLTNYCESTTIQFTSAKCPSFANCELPVLPFSGRRSASFKKVPLTPSKSGIRARPVRNIVHRANYQNSFTRQCSYHLPEHYDMTLI